MRVCIYLWDHSHECMSRQSEGQGRGLREELLMQSFVAGKVLRLGGTKSLLGSGRQVWMRLACISEGKKFMYMHVCLSV